MRLGKGQSFHVICIIASFKHVRVVQVRCANSYYALNCVVTLDKCFPFKISLLIHSSIYIGHPFFFLHRLHGLCIVHSLSNKLQISLLCKLHSLHKPYVLPFSTEIILCFLLCTLHSFQKMSKTLS